MSDTAPVHVRHGSNIGQPLTRQDGLLKVTGGARYAADNHPFGLLHAVMAVSGIARGRVTALDVAAAKAHPGVVEVMTPANAPKLARHPDQTGEPFTYKLDLLQDDRVRYANQPIAVVIADTLEAATEGAALLRRAMRRRRLGSGWMAPNGSCRRRSAWARSRMPARAMCRQGWMRPTRASMRHTRQRRSITTRWSRMPWWRSGTATALSSTRQARG